MNNSDKSISKFKIEEVENRVEFFFLTGVLNKIVGSSNPYTYGGDGGSGSWCQIPKQHDCGTSGTWGSGSDGGFFGSGWGDWSGWSWW